MTTPPAERQAIINRVRRKLTYAPNRSTYLKIKGEELIALYDQLDDNAQTIAQFPAKLEAAVEAAEEREADAVRRQAEAESLAADALAGNVKIPTARAKSKPKAPPAEIPAAYPAIIRAANDILIDYSELWGKPLIEAAGEFADYNGPLPDDWETVVEKALADAPEANP